MPISKTDKIRIPAEWERHSCCWMAWAVHREWRARYDGVKRELREIISTIAKYEPVRLLTHPGHIDDAKRQSFGGNVEIVPALVDDIWMRDIAPTFAFRGDTIVAIDWNFNGWGNTQGRPSRPGDRLAKRAAAVFGVPRVSSSFVTEGGALVTDGRGTMITTRSCLLNSNRNPVRPGVDRQRMIETEMAKLGIRHLIWLEGDPSEPITSGHADGYVLSGPGNLLLVEAIDDNDLEPSLTREHDITLLKSARNADGHKFKVERVLAPRRRNWGGDPGNFAASYLNAYIANGAVIGACFGDAPGDEAARKALARAFPGRDIIMLRIDNIASGGGGIHCLMQPMPSAQLGRVI